MAAAPCPEGAPAGCSPSQPGAVTEIPGVIFATSTDGHIRAHSAEDGRVLWDFDTAREFDAVNKVPPAAAPLTALARWLRTAWCSSIPAIREMGACRAMCCWRLAWSDTSLTEKRRTNPRRQNDKAGVFTLALLAALALAWFRETPIAGQGDALPAPLFHHLHLNSPTQIKRSTSTRDSFRGRRRPTWAGLPALKSPNNVLVVFTQFARRRRPRLKQRSGISAGTSRTCAPGWRSSSAGRTSGSCPSIRPMRAARYSSAAMPGRDRRRPWA